MLDRIAETSVRHIAQEALCRVGLTTNVKTAIDRMKEHHVGACMVCSEDAKLVGIFTERDVLLKSDADIQWLQEPVSRHMTPDPVTATGDEPLAQVLSRMQAGRFRHVPVVDERARPVALLSIRDVLTFVAEHFPEEILNLPPDPNLETRSRWGG